ncbi:MAG: neutral zinc metallopeptidase, partial [Ilumatobacteraceae bacterium]
SAPNSAPADAGDGTTGNDTSPLEPVDDTTPPPADGEGLIDFGDAKQPQSYDNFLNAAFADITQFWADNYETVYGVPFEPVAGIYAMYPERTDLPQSCDGPVQYSDVEGNAFYTSCGDIIVYDDAELLPALAGDLGDAAVGVVAAHEFGHAIQARAGVLDLGLPTVDTEQQADCFAGAWAAHVAAGESDTLTFDDRDVKGGIIAMIEVRDPPGIDVATDPSGHGSAFDRVGAFQEGFIKGITRCADFIDNPNPRVDLVFLGQQDAESGGNLPYAEIAEALPKALDTFWTPTLEGSNITFTPPTLVPFTPDAVPACDDRSADELVNDATFCVDSNTIAYDEAFARDLYQRLGDLSFGYPIAVAYSDAVQVALQSSLTGEPRALLNDCLVGAWIRDIIPTVQPDGTVDATNPAQEILLSAGDLDEAVATAVALGDEASSTDRNGTAFEKIDGFRAGVLGGLSACQDRIDQ